MNSEFEAWLESTQARRDEITAFSKIAMVNVDKAIDFSAELGIMENKADAFVKLEFAKALRESRKTYPDATAKEREAYVKADMAKMEQFVRDLATVARVIRDRLYCRNASR